MRHILATDRGTFDADNLAANYSRELADFIIYIIDVAGGDKIPRKGGPGITQADLLVWPIRTWVHIVANFIVANFPVLCVHSSHFFNASLTATSCVLLLSAIF